jgi:hypothetical protein
MIDWANPLALTPEKFKAVAETLPKKQSERAYKVKLLSDGTAIYNIESGNSLSTPGGKKINLFNGTVQIDSLTAIFQREKPVRINISLGLGHLHGTNARKPSAKDVEKFKTELARVTGDASPKPCEIDMGGTEPRRPGLQWTHSKYKVQMSETYEFLDAGRVDTKTGIFNISILSLAER